MRIAEGVEMLNLSLKAFGDDGVFNPTLLRDGQSAILIDTGLPGQIGEIKKELDRVGMPFESLTAIILTHQDIDHIGNIDLILNELKIDVYAHQLDIPYIEGEKPLLKTDPSKISAEEWEALPDPMKQIYLNPPKATITKALNDGDELPFCGGIQVIHTPGHTPGHISLYHKVSKTMIAADSMFCFNGKLRGPIAHVTPDIEQAVHSLEKYLAYDVENAVSYHGGLASIDVNDQLKHLIDEGMQAVVMMK
ncbi:MBL fold metallo-hydrolase [Heyndrickxia sp. MSNUG]|uniref:MBL fold metallo-hydrolase n=1 Tax=Heyndrickxia sp. MSNUG TaxID=3136677 RepID=UPI003C2F3795